MDKIIIIGGIFMLMYFKSNMTIWNLSTNPNNILSEKLLNIILQVPAYIILILYYGFLLLCLLSLRKNSNKVLKIIMYIITFIILSIGLKITIDLLSFEDYTTYAFFKIYHPVSLEIKQHYLLMQLQTIIKLNNPEIYQNPAILEWEIIKIKENITNIDWAQFKLMGPNEITTYACELLNMPAHKYNLFLGLNTIAGTLVIIWYSYDLIATIIGIILLNY